MGRARHGYAPREYIEYWRTIDGEYPYCVRTALNEFDVPQFWEEIYDISMEAYRDERGVWYCLKSLYYHLRKNECVYFAMSVNECTKIVAPIVHKMNDVINRTTLTHDPNAHWKNK